VCAILFLGANPEKRERKTFLQELKIALGQTNSDAAKSCNQNERRGAAKQGSIRMRAVRAKKKKAAMENNMRIETADSTHVRRKQDRSLA